MLPALLSSCPPFFHHLQLTSIHWMHAYSNADSAKGGVCVCRGKREGHFLLMHLLCSAQWLSKLAHLFCLFSPVSFFLSFFLPVLRLCSVRLVSLSFPSFSYFCLVSDLHARLTRTHYFSCTWSHIHQSCIILPLSTPLLDFGCWSSVIATVFCICSPVVLTASGISSRLRWVF